LSADPAGGFLAGVAGGVGAAGGFAEGAGGFVAGAGAGAGGAGPGFGGAAGGELRAARFVRFRSPAAGCAAEPGTIGDGAPGWALKRPGSGFGSVLKPPAPARFRSQIAL
jgi:hypothetical protein